MWPFSAVGFAAYAASKGLVDGLESPCRAWLGTTASAPSLLRSKGEGWGGGGFCGLSGAAVFAAYVAPRRLVDRLESPCRAWLGTTASAPPLRRRRRGGLGRGWLLWPFSAAGFAAYAAPTRLVDYWESLCRAWLGTTLVAFFFRGGFAPLLADQCFFAGIVDGVTHAVQVNRTFVRRVLPGQDGVG